jgi:predicted transcriptional regulator
MNTLRVGIAGYEEMKARTLAIARGRYKPAPGEPKVWFPSAASFGRILSEPNRALLRAIAESRPESLTRLAELTGRRKSNLSRTLQTMARYGFVRLERSPRGALRPELPYDRIELTLPLRTGFQPAMPASLPASARPKKSA